MGHSSEAPLVLILDSVYESFETERSVLNPIGVVTEHCNPDETDVVERLLPECVGLLVNVIPIDRDLIQKLRLCRVIARYGVGFDNVDVEAATQQGIWVANVQGYATEDVSNHAIGLLFASIRQIPNRDRAVRRGEWLLHKRFGAPSTAGKVMGVLGFGDIGRAFHRKLMSIGFEKFLVYDPFVDDSEIVQAGAVPSTKQQVIEESDFLSLHLPLSDETHHFISHEELAQMKSSAIIVNTSRGALIDTDALVSALRDGEVAFAALDVHETEPVPVTSSLCELENVILTDHCAWFSDDSIIDLKTKAARNVRAVLENGPPIFPVNHPERPRGAS